MRGFKQSGAHSKLGDVFAYASNEIESKRSPKTIGTISLRVSANERRLLERAAGDATLSAYVRGRLFGQPANGRADRALLTKLLSALGQTNLARDLSELQWAEEDGLLVLDDESTTMLRQACADIATMRSALVQALGLREASGQ